MREKETYTHSHAYWVSERERNIHTHSHAYARTQTHRDTNTHTLWQHTHAHTQTYTRAHPHTHFDWCCFCYSIKNSLVALLEALFAWKHTHTYAHTLTQSSSSRTCIHTLSPFLSFPLFLPLFNTHECTHSLCLYPFSRSILCLYLFFGFLSSFLSFFQSSSTHEKKPIHNKNHFSPCKIVSAQRGSCAVCVCVMIIL